ncbi:MAG: esterase/lipase family protein [Gemmatimonadaceae bacterium]
MHAHPPRAAVAALFILTACSGDSPTAPVIPLAHDPVVLVHGLGGSAADWNPVMARLQQDGWTARELSAATYSSTDSNGIIAESIRARVDSILAASGASKVDIVAFSMGSVSSRYYIRNLGGDAKVDAWVSIAGPNHGTETANQCSLTPCIETRPGSAFLTALNAGDETPGAVRYATWWSPCDQTIIPNSSVSLAGAINTQTECLPHTGMFTETVYQQVRAFIAP